MTAKLMGPDPKLFWIMVPLFGVLAACSGGESAQEQQGKAAPASALEQAALDAGVVADIDALSPVGLYRKRHEAGRDSLCIITDQNGTQNFALEAVFGQNSRCRGEGALRVSGDKLVMSFRRSSCLIIASYEGDRVVFPGVVDVACAKLCTARASLEGVSFPRVSRDPGVARAAKRSDGEALCS